MKALPERSAILTAPLEAGSTPPLIVRETSWRCDARRQGTRSSSQDRSLGFSRWTLGAPCAAPVANQGEGAFHTIAVSLQSTDLRFSHGARVIHDGRVTPGVTQITQTGQGVSALFRAPCDVLHLYVPQALLHECYAHVCGRPPAQEVMLGNAAIVPDVAVSRLACALVWAHAEGSTVNELFADCVGIAIVTRLLSREIHGGRKSQRTVTELPRWRLKRAIEFIDAHLSDPIGLEDIAQSTGLTRMHFAAQFRVATGMSPHNYLLQRRVELAQLLLATSGRSVLDIALETGFRSQAHFTTVFRQRVGETPARYRAQVAEELSCET
ncbi:helix-turn-helix domain-containing protein [Paraburkholderia pallida]|uniref:AraC family transcriptional regulator n=1 Tax=Paraburkholderia pallida TaxID=2547399 RepID=A0A4P7D449_9BURK|nr:AraC family transcriptional regulator [Paraburkholderia pallida]QBR01590.1 AraC family transcriptional regulator [Paraburkholderia pallida]